MYNDQDKYVSIININLISYIICVSTDLLILNKWLFCKRYNIVSIINEINADEWVKVVQTFNNDKFFKNSISFSDILIDMTALIDEDYTLTRFFWFVIMRSEWLTTEKNQYVKQIQYLR